MSIPNKKLPPKPPLSLAEIVMRADTETIRAALEARQRIDALLAERAAAYARIAALEHQVDEIIGEPGVFAFPPPEAAVAAYTAAAPAASAAPAAPAAAAKPAPAPADAASAKPAPDTAAAKPAPDTAAAKKSQPQK